MAGVTGLVCAVCDQVVGAINEDALERMLEDDEIYICHGCEARDDIETVLGAQLPDHYAHLIGRVMIDQMLAQEPLSVNVYG
jgi:uncharacterized protein YlaI